MNNIQKTTRHKRINPLDALYKRGGLDLAQYEAGNKLRESFAKGELAASVSSWQRLQHASPTGFSHSSREDLLLSKLQARQKTGRALQEQNHRGKYLLFSLCIDGKNYQEIEEETGWERKYVAERCKEALDDLAFSFGLISR